MQSIKKCPFCGSETIENGEWRWAIYVKDKRIHTIPATNPSAYRTAKMYTKSIGDAYLMFESLDENGRIKYTRSYINSDYVTDENNIPHRRTGKK